jgi:guanine nucleotide-binding protein G(i) subunit alpha
MHVQTKASGVYETRFNMGKSLPAYLDRNGFVIVRTASRDKLADFVPGQLSIHIFQVNSLSGERKKWIHAFENVTSIIFTVDLACYDHVLLEEASQNRMMESLVLFDSVVNSRWFMRTSIILMMCNVALFKAKLDRSPLGNYFPDYSGGNDVNRAAKYLLWRFNQVNRAQLNLYPHLVEHGDTTNIRLVFAAVKETILQNSGILKDIL